MFLGRLVFGPNPFGLPGRRIDPAFLSRLTSGPSPFGTLGLDRLTRGTEPRPMVPIIYRLKQKVVFLLFLSLLINLRLIQNCLLSVRPPLLILAMFCGVMENM